MPKLGNNYKRTVAERAAEIAAAKKIIEERIGLSQDGVFPLPRGAPSSGKSPP